MLSAKSAENGRWVKFLERRVQGPIQSVGDFHAKLPFSFEVNEHEKM
jgi:hypothetical protein